MNTWKKRSLALLRLPLALLVASPLVLLASASTTALKRSDVVSIVANRTYADNFNSAPPSPFAYYFLPHSYGSFQGSIKTYYSLPLIRNVAFGRQKLKTEFSQVDGKFVATSKVVQPIYQALKFFAVGKIVIKTFDGRLKVYDSDDYDISQVKEGLDKNLPVVTLLSINPRSINSLDFQKDLQGARKVSLIPRKDVYYVTSKGKKTKYKLRARDFLFSYLRIYSRTKEFRSKNGGSEKLDDFWYSRNSSDRFTTGKFPNEYLFQLFDIDSAALLDLDGKTAHKPLEKLKIGDKVYEAFSIYRKSSKVMKGDTNFNDFLSQFTSSFLFSPVSSDYIVEQAEKRKDKSHDGSGLIKRIGYYWYGEKAKDNLFIGSYIPVTITNEASERIITFKTNPYYFDKEFLRSKDTLKEAVISYKLQEAKSNQQSVYANFVQGRTNKVSFSQLSDDTLNAILNNRDSKIPRDRITYNISINTLTMPWWFFLSFPSSSVDKNGKPSKEVYKFNDVYSKFMFGASLDDIARGVAPVATHFFGDDQISFRSILNAGVNWETVVKRIGSGNMLFNLTGAPPFGEFNGSDAKTSSIRTANDAPFINDPFVVFGGKRALTIKDSTNLENVNAIKASESLMGGGKKTYQRLQEMMTTLLDRVYKENGFKDSEKMIMPWAIYQYSRIEKIDLATEDALKTMEALDLKGRLKIVFTKFSDKKDFVKFIFTGYSSIAARGWTNDYEGNGSTITALLGTDPFYVVLLSIFSKRDEKDPNNPFPLLTRLSKLLKKGIDDGKYRFKIPFDKWPELTNHQLFESMVTFNDPKLETIDTVFSKFFYDVQDKFTNEEHAKLDVEIAVVMGPQFSSDNFADNVERGSGVIYQKGFYKPYTSSGVSFPQDFLFESLED